ncbi:MAG TPA: crossover junction endodeoxyribonuclease RuvC [Acidimicrobiia bacterium]|nr:crossover junction endodeoxyribonuclease RuvC [Acidimicrobiia bacterium]
MFVMGIDPGLTTTGYGMVRKGSTFEPVAAGVIRTHPNDPIEIRLRELYENLVAVIREHQPEVAAIEQIFTNVNRQTAISVGRAAGVAILAAAHCDIAVFEYAPTQVKSAVAGYGGADKKAVQTMVARRLRLKTPPSPADAADALAVAICHLQSLHLPTGTTR